MSDSNTMREMDNVYRKLDGSIAVRPALRSVFKDDVWLHNTTDGVGVTAVGSIEPYFADGIKCFLFAVREVGGEVGFRVARYDATYKKFDIFTLDDVDNGGFDMPQGYDDICLDPTVTYVKYLQVDNTIFVLNNAGDELRVFWVGADRYAKVINEITEPDYTNADKLTVVFPDDVWIADTTKTVAPTAEVTLTASTLVSSTAALNTFNFAYFYTFNNEIGETWSSMVTLKKVMRAWSGWIPNATDDALSPDQLVAIMPEDVWDDAVLQGATRWNLYVASWSDQAPVPVEGLLLDSKPVEVGLWPTNGWIAHTPLIEVTSSTLTFPNPSSRYNSTTPPLAQQGLVAGDRLILVDDYEQPAIIRWSSNQQGEYTNFSPSVGGGYKTLTSGNLFVPTAIKLWQNPQSVDTLTILCDGVDGYATSYYMAPAQVSGLTQNQTIMGFEETTATPGTVSRYGNEVLNNALYHPLDYELMKSTASNYNITHKSMSDLIDNRWSELTDKNRIVSCQLDNRLYYIVTWRGGSPVPTGCNGNEIWVCDTSVDGGAWTRWTIPAVSLHKLEIDDRLYVAVIRPEGIYILDPLETRDHVQDDMQTTEAPISWSLETNTQGANRAHDVWADVIQASINLGSFQGAIEYGIRGYNYHGKEVEISKVFRDSREYNLKTTILPWDIDDHLAINAKGQLLKEWRFFARSLPDELSYGAINMVQYRYMQSSANVNYQLGSVESFEYAREQATTFVQGNTWNGIPLPIIDARHP